MTFLWKFIKLIFLEIVKFTLATRSRSQTQDQWEQSTPRIIITHSLSDGWPGSLSSRFTFINHDSIHTFQFREFLRPRVTAGPLELLCGKYSLSPEKLHTKHSLIKKFFTISMSYLTTVLSVWERCSTNHTIVPAMCTSWCWSVGPKNLMIDLISR